MSLLFCSQSLTIASFWKILLSSILTFNLSWLICVFGFLLVFAWAWEYLVGSFFYCLAFVLASLSKLLSLKRAVSAGVSFLLRDCSEVCRASSIFSKLIAVRVFKT